VPSSSGSNSGPSDMPVTIRVKKHKSSKPYLSTPGATGVPPSSQLGGGGNKTALSNKTDDTANGLSTPTTAATAIEMSGSGGARQRTKTSYGPNGHPVIHAFNGEMVPPNSQS